jgi:hypothetical protein
MNQDGTGVRIVAPDADSSPTWSPDGERLAFFRHDPPNLPKLQVVTVETGAEVTIGRYNNRSSPKWAPTGDRIAFSALFDDPLLPQFDIMVISATSGAMLTQIATTDHFENGLDWSPDGTRIAYKANDATAPPATSGRVAVVNATGGVPTVLSESFSASGVVWSPDGRLIAISEVRPPSQETRLIRPDGTLVDVVSIHVIDDWQPTPEIKVEFTQGIQELQSVGELLEDLAGDGKPPVALVAEKPAAMRIYFAEVDATTNFTVEVTGEFTDSEAVTLAPGCQPIDRRRQDAGCTSVDFFFTPPEDQWSVRVVVKDFGGTVVFDEEFRLTSVDTPEFEVKYLPVCISQTPFDSVYCPTGFIGGDAPDLMRKLFPAPDDELHYSPLGVPAITFNSRPTPDELIVRLRLYYQLMSMGFSAPDQLVGWVLDYTMTPILGYSDPVWYGRSGRVSWATDQYGQSLGSQFTLAHEVAHNLGLRHTNLLDGCGAQDAGTDWPYPDSTIQEVGFDATEGKAYVETKKDLMTYCSPPADNIWISPHSYRKLLDGQFEPQGTDPLPAGTEVGEYLVIQGEAEADGSAGSLGPAYLIDAGIGGEPPNPDGNHCLRFSGGAPAADFCFTLEFEEHRTHEPLEREPFVLQVPWPEGTAKVSLMRGAQELAALTRSPSAPVLQIDEPTPGGTLSDQAVISWTASDGDIGGLTYAVLYSPDGGDTWLPLGVDLTATELNVDTSVLQGTEVLIRVLASDGLNTTQATVGPVTLDTGLKGDADCSGVVDLQDVMAALELGVGLEGAGCPGRADTDCDGDRDSADVLHIVRFVALLPSTVQGCRAVGA